MLTLYERIMGFLIFPKYESIKELKLSYYSQLMEQIDIVTASKLSCKE